MPCDGPSAMCTKRHVLLNYRPTLGGRDPHDDIDIMFKTDADTLADIIFIVTFSVENNRSYKAMDKLVKRFVKPKLGKLSSIHMLRKWLCRSQVVPEMYLICSQEGAICFG